VAAVAQLHVSLSEFLNKPHVQWLMWADCCEKLSRLGKIKISC